MNPPNTQEPVVLNAWQDFTDLPAVLLRKGIDDEGEPWSPDIILCPDSVFTGKKSIEKQANQIFAGQWDALFTDQPPATTLLKTALHENHYWIFRAENEHRTRGLFTLRIYGCPSGYEEDHAAWTPMDKFLFELEARSGAAIPRRVNLHPLFEAWRSRSYFRNFHWKINSEGHLSAPVSLTLLALITDAARDHPENVCHCGAISECGQSAEAKDSRHSRYPFDKKFRHPFRSLLYAQNPMATRTFRLE